MTYLSVWLDHKMVGCGWRHALVIKEAPRTRRVTLFFIHQLIALEVDPVELRNAKPVVPFHKTKVRARLTKAVERHDRCGRLWTKKLKSEVRAARKALS